MLLALLLALSHATPVESAEVVIVAGSADHMEHVMQHAGVKFALITPDQLRGRVTSFRGMLAGGGPALGQASIGAAATVVGAPLALIVGAVACIAVNIGIMAKDRELRSEFLSMEPYPEPVMPT